MSDDASIRGYTYFDNNATVPMFPEVIKSFSAAALCGNASSNNPVAKIWRDRADHFEQILREQLLAPEKHYEIIWTSGSTEGNCTMINMFTVNADSPRIIICSTIEHKCMILSVTQAEQLPGVRVFWVPPNIEGVITINAIRQTLAAAELEYSGAHCLVCIMHANNETGAVNDISGISLALNDFRQVFNLYFYSDCAQTFGKIPIGMASVDKDAIPHGIFSNKCYISIKNLAVKDSPPLRARVNSIEGLDQYIHLGDIPIISEYAVQYSPSFRRGDVIKGRGEIQSVVYTIPTIPLIDGICFSAHKIGGPFGIGALIVSKRFLERRSFTPISGAQNNGLRGGTYNIPGIIGTRVAFIESMTLHDKIVNSCILGKEDILKIIGARGIPCIRYHDYMTDNMIARSPPKRAFVYFDAKWTLPGTLLCSIVYNDCHMQICNLRLKKFFDAKKIILSIGSACNSNSSGMSHVLKEMNCPTTIALGILRISGHFNGPADYQKMGNAIVEVFSKLDEVCIVKKNK